MTKEEAIKLCKQHAMDLSMLSALMSLSGLAFGAKGKEIEAALELPENSLAVALNKPLSQFCSLLSEYGAVLENAMKGQLTPVEEEWSEIIDE